MKLTCPMTLSLIYSPSFLSPKSSVEGFASWSDMVTVVSHGVSAHQQPRVGRTSLRGLQIRLSTRQHNTAAGGTSATPCVTSDTRSEDGEGKEERRRGKTSGGRRGSPEAGGLRAGFTCGRTDELITAAPR